MAAAVADRRLRRRGDINYAISARAASARVLGTLAHGVSYMALGCWRSSSTRPGRGKLFPDARYTLTVDPGAEGAAYTLFEDKPFAERFAA